MATINLGRIKPVWQGAWNSSTQYVAEDIVQYNNHAWVATTTNTNSAPADANSNWDLMARGLDGTGSTNGQILTADGTGAFTWETPAPSDNASALTQGTLPVARLANGAHVQYQNFSTTSVYENTNQGSWYDLPAPLGDGSANITLTDASNDVILRYGIHCGQESTWRANAFRSFYKIGAGSWNQLTGGGAAQCNWISDNNTTGNTATCELKVSGLNTTETVYFKVQWIGHENGGYLHMNQVNYQNTQGANNINSQASYITLTEVVA